MADEAQVKILKKGVKAWNKWREENPETEVNLRGVDLSGTDLREADLSMANLSGARLYEADLSDTNLCDANLANANLYSANLGGADLSGADLSAANFRRAELHGVNLSGADLVGTNFYGADLHWVNLSGADLRSVDLTKADLSAASLRAADLSNSTVSDTVFADIDLSQTKGLETINHRGPSKISISTIYLSRGKIPFEFLRGAGVPDNFIEYMHSLVGAAFEFYSCFISYSFKDQPFAERLHADLQANGVRCWFAPHHGQGGQKLHEQIDQAIRLHEKLLLILSTESMKSEWVKTEIKKAAKRQKQEKKDVLFPVSLVPFNKLRKWECFDSDLGKDLAAAIREYLIPDFSQWKDHDSYQKAFAKLLKDLRSGKTKTV